jgi:ABC-type antimicrobial peptide transport system permease subunit
VQAVQDAVNQMGFRTFSVLDATKSLRRFFTVLDLFLGIFGSLALAVATLAIINTLVMAVLERRREIGVMKAIGASDQDVKRLFFTEAGAMGFFGGILGIVLGFGIGKAINFGTGVYLHSKQLPSEPVWIMPPWLVGAAIAFSVIVSLLAGLYPASRAAKLDPVQTLKYE